MKCVHCGATAMVIAIDADCDLKQPVCDSCTKTHDYRECELCNFQYAPLHMRIDDGDTATCIYCTGERDFPFFEDVDY